jgi:hypothetical protein
MTAWYLLHALTMKADGFSLNTFEHHAMPFAQPPSGCIQPQLQATHYVAGQRAVSATCLGETKDAASIQLALFDPLCAPN